MLRRLLVHLQEMVISEHLHLSETIYLVFLRQGTVAAAWSMTSVKGRTGRGGMGRGLRIRDVGCRDLRYEKVREGTAYLMLYIFC